MANGMYSFQRLGEGQRDDQRTGVFMSTSTLRLSYFFLTLTDMRRKSINVQLLRMTL